MSNFVREKVFGKDRAFAPLLKDNPLPSRCPHREIMEAKANSLLHLPFNISPSTVKKQKPRYITSYYAYDDHPNPFQQLYVYATFTPVPSYDFDILNFGQSKNNIVSQTTEDLISSGSTYNMT
ncbi:hypothetical protein BH20BAC1_BH20BAC1_13430 [soil metagenome]